MSSGKEITANGISVATLYAHHEALGVLINHIKGSTEGAAVLAEWNRERDKQHDIKYGPAETT